MKFKVEKIRSVSVAIEAEGFVNRAVTGWSLSHALHEVLAMSQCSQVLTASISLMRMRRWSAPCRSAQPLFEKIGSREVAGFPPSHMGCLSCALPCRKPHRKHRKFWGHLPCSWKSLSSKGSGGVCAAVMEQQNWDFRDFS